MAYLVMPNNKNPHKQINIDLAYPYFKTMLRAVTTKAVKPLKPMNKERYEKYRKLYLAHKKKTVHVWLDVEKFRQLLNAKLTEYYKHKPHLLLKSNFGKIRVIRQVTRNGITFPQTYWESPPKEIIKQPSGKADISHISLTQYDKNLYKNNTEFFNNSMVRRSTRMFQKHIQENPQYLQDLQGISLLEAFSIYHYSLKWGVRPLNTDLESNDLSKYTKQYEGILSKALAKLPTYNSKGYPVYHGTTLRDHQIKDLKNKLVNNESFKFGFFTSVGLRLSDGMEYMTKNRGKIKEDERLVLFFIHHKTAKDVTNLRWRKKTHEAIIGHDKEYEVLDIQLRKGHTEIKLREL